MHLLDRLIVRVIDEVMMIIVLLLLLHRLQVLHLGLLKGVVSLVRAAHGHHHLIIGAQHVLLVVRIVLLLLLLLLMLLTVSVIIHMLWHFLCPHVLLLLILRLCNNSFSVEVSREVLESLDFKLKDLSTIEIFIIYGQLLLYLELHQL